MTAQENRQEPQVQNGETPLAAATAQNSSKISDKPLSPDNAGPEINTQWNTPYKGSLGYYLSWGGGIGAVLGWLIALMASINWFGGLVAGAIIGACIGLYLVETKVD